MSVLETKAAEVVDYLKESDEKDGKPDNVAGFAISLLLMVASIIVGCIQIWQGCGSPPVMAMDNLKEDNSTLAKNQIRHVIRKESMKLDRKDRREFRAKMVDAIHQMGTKITLDDMEKLFKEVEEKNKQANA